MSGRLVILGACAAATTLAACGSSLAHGTATSAPASTYTISGTFDLIDFTSASAGCVGQGGYADIAPGTQVKVTDQDGTLIGTGTLGAVTASGDGTTCAFPFTVTGLPHEAFYGVAVSHRGVQDYSFAQLEGNGWQVSLMLDG